MGGRKGGPAIQVNRQAMKHIITLSLCLAAAVFALSCATSNETAKNTNGANAPAQNLPIAQVNTNIQSVNGNTGDQPASVADKINRANRPIDNAPAGPPPPLQFQPAGEDTEIATTMTREGLMVEVRRFKNHPQITKIEAKWLGATDKELKYFLKNGKTVDVKTDKIGNLKTTPVSVLVELAGL